MATNRGKIGRLPNDVREKINRMIMDNATAAQINELIESHGLPAVRPQNLSNWKTGPGFSEWLKRWDRMADMQDRRELAKQVAEKAAEDGDGSLTLAGDTAQALAMDVVLAALEDFDPANLKAMLATDPAKFIGLLSSLSRARRTDQTAEKLRAELALLKGRLDQLKALADEQGQATPEDIAKIFKNAYGVGS